MLTGSLAPLSGAVLLGARLGGLMLLAPVYSARAIPMRARVAVLLLLTIALMPVAQTVAAPVVTPMSLLSETLIGAVIGFGAALLVGGAETAGEWIAVQMGLSGATTVNPLSTISTPVLGNFLSLTAVMLMLAVDGHIVMLEAVVATTELAPLGTGVQLSGGAASAIVLGTGMFLAGLRFAAPVIAVLLVVNAGLGILARTVPQLNLLMLAFPIQIGLGLMALALGMPLLSGVFAGWPVAFEDVLGRSLTGLLPTTVGGMP